MSDICMYCNSTDEFNKDLVGGVVDKNGTVLCGVQTYIEDGELKLYFGNAMDDGFVVGHATINYCPICGRKIGTREREKHDTLAY